MMQSFFGGGGFNAAKLKPQLKMACGRIQIASNKKAALLKQSTREVAVLLAEEPPKEEKARIRAEALIRDDNLIEAYEILQLECELLHERIKLLQYSKECPHDLVSVVSTLIWASHRVDIPELAMIRKQFTAKYGKQFADNALQNKNSVLNERVVSKLSVEPPAAYLVQVYLERICEKFEVDWSPSMKLTADSAIQPMAPPSGQSVPVGAGTGLGGMPHASTGEEAQEADMRGSNVTMPTAPSFRNNYGNYGDINGGNSRDNDDDNNGGGGAEPDIPVAPTTSRTHLFSKPKPFIPPPAPGKGGGNNTAPNSFNTLGEEDKKDDDDDNNNGGGGEGSYADLTARFGELNK